MCRPGVQIVWFKRDLRVRDHQPLTLVASRGSGAASVHRGTRTMEPIRQCRATLVVHPYLTRGVARWERWEIRSSWVPVRPWRLCEGSLQRWVVE